MRRSFATAAAAVITAVSLAGTAAYAGVTTNPAFPAIVGNGSSFQANFQAACAGKFTNSVVAGFSSKAKVSYTSSSSGDGMTALGNGSAAFAGTDAPDFTTSTYAPNDSGSRVAVPLTVAPVAFLYNVSDKNGALIKNIKLTAAIISDIYLGNITKWNDDAIQLANGATKKNGVFKGGLSAKLPNEDIKVGARTDGSGTTKNVVIYLAANVPSAGWYAAGSKNMTGGGSSSSYANSGSLASSISKKSNSAALVEYVAQTEGTIAYADAPDVPKDLGVAKLQNVHGEFVAPTTAAAALAVGSSSVATALTSNGYLSSTESANLFTASVANAYQLTVITYIQASDKASVTNKAVRAYAQYALAKCQGGAGYTKLPANLLTIANTQAAKIGATS